MTAPPIKDTLGRPAGELSGAITGGTTTPTSFYPAYQMTPNMVITNGTTDARAALNTLVNTTIPNTGFASQAILLAPNEIVLIGTSMTIPPHVRIIFAGGVFKIASGAVLTIMTQPEAEYKIFDTSLGGTVAMGGAFIVRPEWWGADHTGVVDASAARTAAMRSLYTEAKGGTYQFVGGTYSVDAAMNESSLGFSRVRILGAGNSTIIKNNAKLTNVNGSSTDGMLCIRGTGVHTHAQHVEIGDFAMQGVDTGDCATPIQIDEVDWLYLHDLDFENFGIECIRSISGTEIDWVLCENISARNTGIARAGAVINLNSGETIIRGVRLSGVSMGIETNGSSTIIDDFIAYGVSAYAIVAGATWSSWTDRDGNIHVSKGFSITNFEISDGTGRAVHIPDFTGHSTYAGFAGEGYIAHFAIRNMAIPIYGGTYAGGTWTIADGLISGQHDDGTGPQNFAIAAQAGNLKIHHVNFERGTGEQFTGLIGWQIVGPTPDRIEISDCEVKGLPCNSVMFAMTPLSMVARTRVTDVAGVFAAATGQVIYRWYNASNVVIAELKVSEFAWWDVDHAVSISTEYTVLPLASDALPATFVFKPGDRLVARFPNATWTFKRCIAGGTLNPTPLAITGTATAGATTMVVSSAAALSVWQWITASGITSKRIVSISGTTITVDTPFEVGVPGTTIFWATPLWAIINAAAGSYVPLAGGVMTGDLTAPHFLGDGAGLTNVPWNILTGVPTTVAAAGLTDALTTAMLGAASGVASLDSGGKVPTSQLPAFSVSNTFVVASQAAMLALSTALAGDIAVRTDLSETFILSATPASTLGNWVQLLSPTSPVTSVFGRTGAVVSAANDYSFAQLSGIPTTVAGYGFATDLYALGDARWFPIFSPIFLDTVSRADSTTSPGTPTLGGPYTVMAGTLGIVSGKLVPQNTGFNARTTWKVDPGLTLIDFSTTFRTSFPSSGFYGAQLAAVNVRYVDANNYIYVELYNNRVAILIVSNDPSVTSVTDPGAYTYLPGAGPAHGPYILANTDYVLRVQVIGNHITVFLNSVLYCQATLSSFAMAVFANATIIRWDMDSANNSGASQWKIGPTSVSSPSIYAYADLRYSLLGHTHVPADIIGVIPPAQLGTGTVSAGHFLDGDGVFKSMRYEYIAPETVPLTAGASGLNTQFAFDPNWLYVCVGTNTWKRVALSSF